MQNAINNFLDNLFNTHSIIVNVGDQQLFELNIGYRLQFVLIVSALMSIALIFVWFIHILVEVKENDC